MDDALSVFVALVVVTLVWLVARAVIRCAEVRAGAAEELRTMRGGQTSPVHTRLG